MKTKPKRHHKKIRRVTEHKEKEASEKLKSLADFTSENPQPSLRIGKDGTLLYANAASLPLMSNWGKRIGDVMVADWRELIKEVLISGIRENIEVECKGRVYAFIVVPVRKANYVNLYGRDITERKKAEERLRAAYNELKRTQSQLIQAEKMNVIGMLASGIAHELKNPLAILLQSVEYLSKGIKDKGVDEGFKSAMTFMEDAVKRADDIVKGLLDFSRLSELNLNTEDLHKVIEKALSWVKHKSDEHHINIKKYFSPDIPKLRIDHNKIGQVFVNLFMNAIQAMPEGGELKIKTYTRKSIKQKTPKWRVGNPALEIEKIYVIVEIEDTGEGIPDDALKKIFNPFFTTKRNNVGTGLGLSIVKNIMDMHNAKLEITNKKPHGTRVTATFTA